MLAESSKLSLLSQYRHTTQQAVILVSKTGITPVIVSDKEMSIYTTAVYYRRTLRWQPGNVQRRATRLIGSLSEKTYTERLIELGLPSLQYRRARADMVETYKIINDIDIVNKERITPTIQTRTRGHHHKIYKRQFRLDVRKNSFSQRIVNRWNSLPDDVVTATSVNQFKDRLNKTWKDIEIKFSPDCYQCATLTKTSIQQKTRLKKI